MRNNKDHVLARPGQRFALLVKHSHVKRLVHRRQMDDFGMLMHVYTLKKLCEFIPQNF